MGDDYERAITARGYHRPLPASIDAYRSAVLSPAPAGQFSTGHGNIVDLLGLEVCCRARRSFAWRPYARVHWPNRASCSRQRGGARHRHRGDARVFPLLNDAPRELRCPDVPAAST
jgi:hypothetical protein